MATRVTPELTTFGEGVVDTITNLEDDTGADSTGFLALGATPSTFTGQDGLAVVVDEAAGELVFATLAGGGPASFIGLSETPGSWGTEGQLLEINSTTDGLQWVNPPAAPPDEFTDLLDTPMDFTGHAGEFLVVDPDGSELIFTAITPSGASTFVTLGDTPDNMGDPGTILQVAPNGLELIFADLATGSGQGVDTFVELDDTPTSIVPGAYLRGDPDGTGLLEFVAPQWPSTFVAMSDTPTNFEGDQYKYVRVNEDEDGVEFITPPTVPSNLTELTGFPADYGTVGQILITNGTTAATWEDPTLGTVDEFIDLTDVVPANYVGSTGQYVTSNGSGLIFSDLPSIPSFLTELMDMPANYAGNDGKILMVNETMNRMDFVDPPTGTGSTGTDAAIPPLMVAVTDETSVISTGTAKMTFRAPYGFELQEIRASLTTAGSTTTTVDVNMNGTTVFSTLLTIDATERTSTTAAIAAVLSTTTVPDDAEFTIDIDGAGTNAVGLKLSLIPV